MKISKFFKQRWLAGFLCLALVGGFLFNAPNALAGVGVGVAPDFPASLAVGQTGVAVGLEITNNSTPDVGNITLSNIRLIPQCGNTDADSTTCLDAIGEKDPGVFTVSATGTGASACVGTSFTVAVTDATTGQVTFTPSAPIVLAIGATCRINFTVNVNIIPTHDASAAIAGIQTLQIGKVTGTQTGGALDATGAGSDITTITKASPTISTIPTPASGPVGTMLNDTATLSGGSSPTGSVTFKLLAPSDPTCTGTPAYTQTDPSAPYATSPGFASNATGTWHWTADYAGDANNNSASSGCSAEPVTVSKLPSTVTTHVHNASHSDITNTTVTVGTQVHDQVTVTGSGPIPTGTVTFQLFTANCAAPLNAPIESGVALVSGMAESTPFTPAVGSYGYIVTYSGDANYDPATGACEPFTVEQPRTQGCSPGYWKQSQHFDSYPAGFGPNTQFSAVFENAFPGKTLVQVLSQGGGGLNALGRIIVGAYLNASTITGYAYTPSQVVSDFNAAFPGGDYNTLKAKYEALQDPCPLN